MSRFPLFFILLSAIISPLVWHITSVQYLSPLAKKQIDQFRLESKQIDLFQKQKNILSQNISSFIRYYHPSFLLRSQSLLDIYLLGDEALLKIITFQQTIRPFKFEIPIGLPVKSFISPASPFGIRLDPFEHKKTFHTGVDLIVSEGEPIFSSANGTILASDQNPDYGNNVVIAHNYGFITLYAHLKSVHRYVYLGREVKKGTIIGYAGNTGRSKGSHLHYEIQLNGLLVDPKDFLNWAKNLYF